MAILDRLGLDISTFVGGSPDLDPVAQLISGERSVVESVARRWLTPKGSLPGPREEVEDYGEDCRGWLQARNSATKRAALRASLQAQALLEERVKKADVTVEQTATGLRIVGVITPDTEKPMRLTLTVSEFRTSVQIEAV